MCLEVVLGCTTGEKTATHATFLEKKKGHTQRGTSRGTLMRTTENSAVMMVEMQYLVVLSKWYVFSLQIRRCWNLGVPSMRVPN